MSASQEKPAFTLDELDLAPADRATVRDFLESWLEHGRPVLFVGAGMSRHNAVRRAGAPASAEIKDWGGLVDTLRQRLAGGDETVLNRLPSDYLRLAQLHETQFQRVRLVDAVEESLANAHFDPGPAHARLKRFQWEAIITTNYDDLLERTFAHDQTRHVTKVVWDVDLTRRRPATTLLLVKMHGDLHDRDSIVLTEEDYRCYEQGRPGVALKVKQLLLEHPSLFVGFSLSDPNVGAIEGWIRDTTGRLKLPSVVLVHSEPLIAERDMWARRGIKLVHLRGESLARFFDALHGERERRSKAPQTARDPVGEREMDKILEQRKVGWETDAAQLLTRLIDGAHESEFASAARYVLQGGIRKVPAESIQKVLDALSDAQRRAVLLRAHAHGILKAGGSGVMVLDLEQYLLDDVGLSPNERGGLLLNRATREQAEGKLREARDTLIAARAFDLDEITRGRLQKQLREVLLRIGDDHGIAEELLDAPLPEDSFAYARRGSDALLTRGRLAAIRWYAEALNCARDGDEKSAALAGLQACTEPSDWSRMSELDEQRLAILKEERPRAEHVHDLQDAAGAKLLERHRLGPQKQGYEVGQAIEKLRQALAEADDMGWPRSAGPNLTTVSDGLAYATVGLLLAEGSSAEGILEAVAFTIERGLFGVGRHFDPQVFDRLVADPDCLARVREVLQLRKEAAFMARTRSLLRSALLPLLPDDEITAHVVASVDVAELTPASFFEKSATETHLELLVQHQIAMPRGAAEHLLRSFATLLRNEENTSSLRGSWLRAPLADWVKTGVIGPDDETLRDLIAALCSLFDRGLVRRDFMVRLTALRWLDQLVQAQLLSGVDQEVFAALLDSELQHAVPLVEQGKDELVVLELASARAEMGPWSPPAAVRDVFLASYDKLKNSTAIGRWTSVVKVFASALNDETRSNIARDVGAYVDASLVDRHRTFGPYPHWAADAVCQAARSGIITSAEALTKIEALGVKFPEVLWRAVELPGIDLDLAEERMLAGLAMEHDDHAVLVWCQELPPNHTSRHLERITLGGLSARDGRSRQLAYWSAAALAKNGNLSPVGCVTLAEAIAKFGAADRDWHVRSAAIAAASRVLGYFNAASVAELVATGSRDPLAGVRRAADLLQRAASGNLVAQS